LLTAAVSAKIIAVMDELMERSAREGCPLGAYLTDPAALLKKFGIARGSRRVLLLGSSSSGHCRHGTVSRVGAGPEKPPSNGVILRIDPTVRTLSLIAEVRSGQMCGLIEKSVSDALSGRQIVTPSPRIEGYLRIPFPIQQTRPFSWRRRLVAAGTLTAAPRSSAPGARIR
jgi:hypothetical protein